MSGEGCTTCCTAGPKLIYTCSGAADVGAIADQAGRKLSRDGKGKMCCLAGIGGRVSGFMLSTQSAAAVLVIDGCPLCCAKKCLEEAGFTGFEHLQLSEIGLEKGRSPVTEAVIVDVAEKGAALLDKKIAA